MNAEWEMMFWRGIPVRLQEETVNSLDELQILFSEHGLAGEITVDKKEGPLGFKTTLYKQEKPGEFPETVYVAYECNSCKLYLDPSIRIGPPKIEDDNSINFLTRREATVVRCTGCYSVLYERVHKLS